MIPLDIFSDPICPWCHIGLAHLNRALAGQPDHPFSLAFHPFQLNPEMPPEGADRQSYLAAKFGADRVAAMEARLEAAAAEAGAAMNLAAMTRVPNTLDAHRVIHWAGLEGVQAAVKAALMRGYFAEGRDIGDRATLAEIAGQSGMNRAVVARLLASDADRDEIRARDSHARARGISAVPTFLVANTYVLQGAQPAAVWTQAIAEIAAQAG